MSAADCPHENFAANVGVQRLTDDAGAVRHFVAEVTVRCTQCNLPFHFVGPSAGFSFRHPTVNIGATTLHAPIAPGENTTIPTNIRFEMPPRADRTWREHDDPHEHPIRDAAEGRVVSAPTDRQLEVLEFMRRFQRENQMPPTLREICKEFGWRSHIAARDHVLALAKKGLVEHRPNIARGWRALQPSQTDEVGA